MLTPRPFVRKTIEANIEQWKAEQAPIAPQDLRCIERWQNDRIGRLEVEIALLLEANHRLNDRLDALEKNTLNWPVNFPAFPYRVVGNKPYRRTHWEGCQAVHTECGEVAFDQANLFEPAPDPIDAPRAVED